MSTRQYTCKLVRLESLLCELKGLLVAFSGGVDSTFLLAVAARVLGDGVHAGTVLSPLNPPSELDNARELASILGVRHWIVELDPLQDQRVASNPPDRCYWCKRAVFTALRRVAMEQGLFYLAHGEHAGDAGDHRPGQRAAQEMGVRAPLAEAGLNKEEIRELSRAMGLPTWNRPSMACLASRIPYGDRLTREVLTQVARAEEALRQLGLAELRVRHHGDVARVELPSTELSRLADQGWRKEIVRRLKDAGYRYVTLDLEGLRSGSMNEVLVSPSERTPSGGDGGSDEVL